MINLEKISFIVYTLIAILSVYISSYLLFIISFILTIISSIIIYKHLKHKISFFKILLNNIGYKLIAVFIWGSLFLYLLYLNLSFEYAIIFTFGIFGYLYIKLLKILFQTYKNEEKEPKNLPNNIRKILELSNDAREELCKDNDIEKIAIYLKDVDNEDLELLYPLLTYNNLKQKIQELYKKEYDINYIEQIKKEISHDIKVLKEFKKFSSCKDMAFQKNQPHKCLHGLINVYPQCRNEFIEVLTIYTKKLYENRPISRLTYLDALNKLQSKEKKLTIKALKNIKEDIIKIFEQYDPLENKALKQDQRRELLLFIAWLKTNREY